jgi:hypothetical protein
MPNVDRATHLGIIRTTSMKSNIRANVDENRYFQSYVVRLHFVDGPIVDLYTVYKDQRLKILPCVLPF